MDLQALKVELTTFLTNTTTLTTDEKKKLRDRTVLIYRVDFNKYLAENGLPDTAQNRSKFFIEKVVGSNTSTGGISGSWGFVYVEGSRIENAANTPPPDTWG